MPRSNRETAEFLLEKQIALHNKGECACGLNGNGVCYAG